AHGVAHDALTRDVSGQLRTYQCGQLTLNITRHSVIPGPRRLRCVAIKPRSLSEVVCARRVPRCSIPARACIRGNPHTAEFGSDPLCTCLHGEVFLRTG